MSSAFLNLNDPVIFQSFGGDEYWTKVDFPAGSTILKEGEDSQDFFYIFSGSVEISKGAKSLATLNQGDFFGEGSLLSDRERSATVTAETDVVLLKLSQPKFEALVLKDAQAAVGIILGIVKVLNGRLREMMEKSI